MYLAECSQWPNLSHISQWAFKFLHSQGDGLCITDQCNNSLSPVSPIIFPNTLGLFVWDVEVSGAVLEVVTVSGDVVVVVVVGEGVLVTLLKAKMDIVMSF